MTGLLVVLRHGQSRWNDEHRFTGWADPDLAATGRTEATAAAGALRGAGLQPELVLTSVLARARQTVELLPAGGLECPRVVTDWRLNERHYGQLEGMTHAEAAGRYGAATVAGWRRDWADRPPLLDDTDARSPRRQSRYASIPPDHLPMSESLQACLLRSWPAITEHARPVLDGGGTVLLVGHGNGLRALLTVLEELGPRQVQGVVLPTGVARAYRLDDAGGWQRESAPPLTGTPSGP